MMELAEFVRLSLQEDLGDGDHSSLSCFPPDAQGKAKLLVKDTGILAGVQVAVDIFAIADPSLRTELILHDGDSVAPGQTAFTVTGPIRAILGTERLVLNVMQRMSGIATRTHAFVKLIEGTGAKLLDTRKTTPLLRALEKEAVRIGGGYNHRMGLYDMIMLKDNHVDYAGGVEQAIDKANAYLRETGRKLQIEIEVRNMDELQSVLKHGQVNRIMLDNFSVPDMAAAVALIGKRFETEASGGITETTIRAYAETGVDYISVGVLTHSVKSFDLSLKAQMI
jgi:nicotinate-nucleotide pyrophosphorylase (carboxylating)